MACVALFATQAFGQNLKLGPMFTDGMVLQQGQTVPVWGNAKPKATVKITFGRTKVNVKADANGYWKAMLPRQSASAEGQALSIVSGKDKVTVYSPFIAHPKHLCYLFHSLEQRPDMPESRVNNVTIRDLDITATKFFVVKRDRPFNISNFTLENITAKDTANKFDVQTITNLTVKDVTLNGRKIDGQ